MIGQSFSPTNTDPTDRQQPASGGTPDSALQQAIQVLQLRMPRFFGSNAPAPAALLQGSAPIGFNPQAFLQRLMGMLPQATGMAPQPLGGTRGNGQPVSGFNPPSPPMPMDNVKPVYHYALEPGLVGNPPYGSVPPPPQAPRTPQNAFTDPRRETTRQSTR